jgi:hypothetical protein
MISLDQAIVAAGSHMLITGELLARQYQRLVVLGWLKFSMKSASEGERSRAIHRLTRFSLNDLDRLAKSPSANAERRL